MEAHTRAVIMQAPSLPLLVGDIGSTKGSWCLLEGWSMQSARIFHTPGFSPVYGDDASIRDLQESLRSSPAMSARTVMYFGTGCYQRGSAQTMAKYLSRIFPMADIRVASDLTAAGIACGAQEGDLVAILGTGSSVCQWRGDEAVLLPQRLKTVQNGPDPGSGTAIGQDVINILLSEDRDKIIRYIPTDMQEFNRLLQLGRNRAGANHSVAAYAKPCLRYLGESELLKGVFHRQFEAFLEDRVLPFMDGITGTVHFAGSIAFHAKKQIEVQISDKGITLGHVTNAPLEGVVNHIIKRQHESGD